MDPLISFFQQIAPLIAQYQQALEEEQKYLQAKMRREQLEQQLLSYRAQLAQFSQPVIPNVQPYPQPFVPTCPNS